jgi:allatostatin receptor
MRNTTNVLILNLAVADLLFIVFCVPFTATDYALNYWPFGLMWCQAVQVPILPNTIFPILHLSHKCFSLLHR